MSDDFTLESRTASDLGVLAFLSILATGSSTFCTSSDKKISRNFTKI